MSEVSEGNAIMRPTLHHINLKTIHLQEMIDWYGTVVGMKPNYQFPGGAWLTNDAANHRLALLTSPLLSDDPDKLMHTGIHHSAFEYPTMGDLLDTYSRLKTLGIEPHACLDHGMTTSFYYEDPDGNSVELQSDNFGNWEQSGEWTRTSPQFAADPIGMPVDPSRWWSPTRPVPRSPNCTSGPTVGNLSPLARWTYMCRLAIHVLRCRTVENWLN